MSAASQTSPPLDTKGETSVPTAAKLESSTSTTPRKSRSEKGKTKKVDLASVTFPLDSHPKGPAGNPASTTAGSAEGPITFEQEPSYARRSTSSSISYSSYSRSLKSRLSKCSMASDQPADDHDATPSLDSSIVSLEPNPPSSYLGVFLNSLATPTTPVTGSLNLKCEKHSDLWFLDGSVILKAQSTLFRVHMSQLSRHSLFFKDLFSLPQPPSCLTDHDPSLNAIKDAHEGIPLIPLQDDADDVANLLTALYDGP